MKHSEAVIAFESLAPGETRLINGEICIGRQRDGLYVISMRGYNFRLDEAVEQLIIEMKYLEKVRGHDRSANEE